MDGRPPTPSPGRADGGGRRDPNSLGAGVGEGRGWGVLPSLRPKQSVTKSSAAGSSRGGCNSAFVLPAWVAEPWPSRLPTLPPIILLAYLPGEGSGVPLKGPLVQDHRSCPTCQPTCGRWIFPEALLPTPTPSPQDWGHMGAKTLTF